MHLSPSGSLQPARYSERPPRWTATAVLSERFWPDCPGKSNSTIIALIARSSVVVAEHHDHAHQQQPADDQEKCDEGELE
jgi:hypothetical protein